MVVKRGLVLILAAALVAILASSAVVYADPPDGRGKPPEWAQGQGRPPDVGPQSSPDGVGQRRGLFGEITGVDVTANTIVLTTKIGDVTVGYADAKCNLPKPLGGTPGKPQACADAMFKVGDYVAVSGTWDGATFDAKRINWIPGRSLHGHWVGTVSGDPTSASTTIAVVRSDGVSRTFNVDGTKIRPVDTSLEDIDNGDTVTVVYTRDRSANEYTAKVIVVHHEAD